MGCLCATLRDNSCSKAQHHRFSVRFNSGGFWDATARAPATDSVSLWWGCSCQCYVFLSCLTLSSLGMSERQMMSELHRASGEINLKSPFVEKGAPKRSSRLDLGPAVQSLWNNPSVVFLFLSFLINKCNCSVWHCMLCSGRLCSDGLCYSSRFFDKTHGKLINPDLHVLTCKMECN